jgi:hypothetical protein
MIAENPIRPRLGRKCRFVIVDDLLDRTRVPWRRQQREIERQLRAAKVFAVVGDQTIGWQINLSDQNTAIEFIDHAPHLRDHVVDFGLIGGMNRQNPLVRRPSFSKRRIWRVVAKLRVLDQVPDHVDAEAVDSFSKPEAHHVMDRVAHRGIAPIQVGLLGQEGMVVILPCRGVILPGAPAEFRKPVVRRTPARCGITPYIPIALRVLC